MRGRAQASAVALLGSLVPVISPATIGLVTLRKGSTEGFLVALWALLPVILSYALGGVDTLLSMLSIVASLMMVIAANVLRQTISWQWAMLASVVVSVAVVLVIRQLYAAEVESAAAGVAENFATLEAQQLDFVSHPDFLAGLGAWVVALGTILSLMVARWWQALLYNPGGFRQEFHSLRVEKPVALVLATVLLLGLAVPRQYAPWAELFGLPLLIAGVAFVHHLVTARQLGGHWLGLMYFGLLLISPVSLALIGLGFADSVLNLRSRLTRKGEGL